MSAPNVLRPVSENFTPSLFGRPTRNSYRTAVAQVIRELKARHKLSNERMAEAVGCCEDTIRNAENENGNLDAVTLLSIAFVYGEEAIEPVRQLYLCKPAERPTIADRLARIERETAMIRAEGGAS